MSSLGSLGRPGCLGLATDLYQLTMAAAYWTNGIGAEPASFEMFVRRLPAGRGYLIAAGLEQALEYLDGLSFGGEAVDHLRRLPVFSGIGEGFWDYLRGFRFEGDVDALPEGTVVFGQEPLLRVTGPLIQAQLVETFLLATLNHQTMVASKAARVVQAAAGRGVVEFGARRAHGFDAALYGARAAVIGGCVGTSNVLAGEMFGLTVYGTAAHSFTMAFEHEEEAFAAYARAFPESTTLLIDTYDTLEGARRAVRTCPHARGVRLDSGDLVSLSKEVRRILDEGGMPGALIVASGDLNEERVAAVLAEGAPIDLFGVGTDLITSRDAPALGGVYKLVEITSHGEKRPVRKFSPEKATLPGCKQVFRGVGPGGAFEQDTIGLEGESVEGLPLMVPVRRQGRAVRSPEDVHAARARAMEQLQALSPEVRRLEAPAAYPVELSPGLLSAIDRCAAAGE